MPFDYLLMELSSFLPKKISCNIKGETKHLIINILFFLGKNFFQEKIISINETARIQSHRISCPPCIKNYKLAQSNSSCRMLNKSQLMCENAPNDRPHIITSQNSLFLPRPTKRIYKKSKTYICTQNCPQTPQIAYSKGDRFQLTH